MRDNKFIYTEVDIPTGYYESSQSSYSHIKGSYSGIPFGREFKYNDEQNNFLNDLLTTLNPETSIQSGLLFPAVLYSYPGFLVFERPPTNKLVQYIDVPVESISAHEIKYNQHSYNLALPWQLYIAQYDPGTMRLYKAHMYFMNESYKNCNQIMYSPPLPNFYADGSLCRPFFSSMEDIEKYEKNLSGVMASTYDWIWNSGFNHDLLETVLNIYQHKDNSFYNKDHKRTIVSHTSHRYLHPVDVRNVLKIWEDSFTLDNILTAKWANLSVSTMWDSEVEWFYEIDYEYPFERSGEEAFSCDSLEEYSENYPIKLYDLEKTFKIMVNSAISGNFNFGVVNGSKFNNFSNRFGLYHRLLLDPISNS